MRWFRPAAVIALLALTSPIEAQTALRTRVYASGFSAPVVFVQDPTNPSVQYVVEQGGRIRVVQSGTVLATDFLDLRGIISSGGEQGLLGMAFAPDYATTRRFYVNFTNPAGNTVVARFRRSAGNALTADPASRFDLRWGPTDRFIFQPFANHNGGNLAFGPDGFLYIGMGDGGAGGDPAHHAQTPADLLGKMLRVDVNVPDGDPIGYQVPPSNPFVSGGPAGTRPEIWSFGLRNPWRFSFDDPARGGTGALVIGDVGQSEWEEIDYQPANRGGRNYGWRNREGAHDYDPSLPPAFSPLVDPIHEYDHSVGSSVTGGYVYRGHALGAAYRGRYFFADFVAGRVWSLALTIDQVTGEATASNVVEHTAALSGGTPIGNISSFGVGWDGELYAVSYSRGAVLKIEPAAAVAGRDGDFDGDRRADVTIFRPSDGIWYTRRSGTGAIVGTQWGSGSDVPVPGDYDGDGVVDIAVFRLSDGVWYLRYSATGTTAGIQWGNAADRPMPGDYDGDGKTDIAVFRPSDGIWYLRYSSNPNVIVGVQWGNSQDVPAPADYDGDGRVDIAVFRPSDGIWYIRYSATGTIAGIQWGSGSDKPVAADYDGDGRADIAVFRLSDGVWYIRYSATGTTTGVQWGNSQDVPVPGDFDGDGRTDIAVFRPSDGTWYFRYSSTGATGAVQWGNSLDVPILKRP